jgi:hypothetical protein
MHFFYDDVAHLRDKVLHRRGVVWHNEKNKRIELTSGEPVGKALMPKSVFEDFLLFEKQ